MRAVFAVTDRLILRDFISSDVPLYRLDMLAVERCGDGDWEHLPHRKLSASGDPSAE